MSEFAGNVTMKKKTYSEPVSTAKMTFMTWAPV